MYFANKVYLENLKSVCENVADIRLLSEKSILITGAMGLIGSFLVDCCLYLNKAYGCKIHIYALGRNEERMKHRFSTHVENGNLNFIIQDVTLPLRIEDKIDYIIHAAGDGYPAAFREHPVETMTPAFIGTYHLLESAKKLGVRRFIYISSGEIYGKTDKSIHAFKESDCGCIDSMSVRSCYPIAKIAAETLCISYSQEYGIETVIVRPGHVYGSAASPNDNRATVQFLNNAIKKKRIVMYSPGLQMRSYTYVADCVAALLTVCLRGNGCEAYNIANPESRVTIREFAEILAKISGGEVEYEIREPNQIKKKEMTPIEYAVLDSTKLEKLGWKPQYSIERGIEDMYRIGVWAESYLQKLS